MNLQKLIAKANRTPDGCLELPRQGSRRYYATKFKEFGHKTMNAHRAVWLLQVGPIPPGQFVCHSCDNGYCIEPSHLWLGTPSDNQEDCFVKHRNPMALETHHSAKLTNAQALEIRNRINGGWTLSALATAFGVSQRIIYGIKRGETWKKLHCPA